MSGFVPLPDLQKNEGLSIENGITSQDMESLMLEFMATPPFLIVAAIFAVFLVIGIAKRAVRLLLWTTVIFVILIGLGFMNYTVLLGWFENILKR